MAYSDFTIDKVKEKFGITFDEEGNFFADVAPVTVSELLRQELAENVPMAQAIRSEKARSELIIMPVLMEVRRQVGRQISLFSGVDFTVDSDNGLKGTCDFILSLSKEQLLIESPVVAIAEAKRDDFPGGFGQCAAEMVGARVFNQQRNANLATIFGVVTTGNLWRFLRLVGETIYIDEAEYHIGHADRILGILVSMCQSQRV